MNYISLSYADIGIAAALMVVCGGLSIAFNLKLESKLFIASLRMTAQLVLIGLVLKILFSLTSPLLTGLMAAVMILVAGYEITARQTHKLPGWRSYGLGIGILVIAPTLIVAFALLVQIKPDPWYDPRYLIPLLGMLLGNTLTGVSLGLNTLMTSAKRDRIAIEAQLTLGKTKWQAMKPVMRHATYTAFMPIINTMSATGIVSLPGMMTGQILAGVDPVDAVKYQLLVMFLIGGATGIGVVLAILGGTSLITDQRHRLRLDRFKA